MSGQILIAYAFRSSPGRGRQGSGYILLELVVFIVIASVFLSVALVPFVSGVRDHERPMLELRCAFLAQSEINRLCALPFSDASLAPTADDGEGITGLPAGFSGRKSITYIDEQLTVSHTPTGYKKVSVMVSYGEKVSVELGTIVTNWERY